MKIISVGNLSVGGTGKTPHIEYLIRLLKEQFPIAVLSRGYGRKTKGFVLADESATAKSIGDEPMQFYQKFSGKMNVAVGEDRVLAVPLILHENPEIRIVLLDDAYQHRRIDRDLNILLTDYNKPFYNDHVLPAGRLRESRKGARRADIVLVTKCPFDLDKNEKENVESQIRRYTFAKPPVFFTGIQYGNPVPVFDDKSTVTENVILFSGIADDRLLKEKTATTYNLINSLIFRDHHNYQRKDIEKILTAYRKSSIENVSLLTTEKDAVRLHDPEIKSMLKGVPLFYIPIEVRFLHNKEQFDELIKSSVSA